jgi:hypothetical protein
MYADREQSSRVSNQWLKANSIFDFKPHEDPSLRFGTLKSRPEFRENALMRHFQMEISSGSFDSAPVSFFRTKVLQRFAQADSSILIEIADGDPRFASGLIRNALRD